VREVPVAAHGEVEPSTVEWLRVELRDRRTLAGVFAWMRTRQPPYTVTQIVTQDEYTHDVVVALEPRLCVVFDAT
jgi:hypothetical protein